jgi:hypothetical protein
MTKRHDPDRHGCAKATDTSDAERFGDERRNDSRRPAFTTLGEVLRAKRASAAPAERRMHDSRATSNDSAAAGAERARSIQAVFADLGAPPLSSSTIATGPASLAWIDHALAPAMLIRVAAVDAALASPSEAVNDYVELVAMVARDVKERCLELTQEADHRIRRLHQWWKSTTASAADRFIHAFRAVAWPPGGSWARAATHLWSRLVARFLTVAPARLALAPAPPRPKATPKAGRVERIVSADVVAALQGKRVLLLGGRPDERRLASLQSTFQCASIEWPRDGLHESRLQGTLGRIANGAYDIVVDLRWMGHKHSGRIARAAESGGTVLLQAENASVEQLVIALERARGEVR